MLSGETLLFYLHISVAEHCKYLMWLDTCSNTGAFETQVSKFNRLSSIIVFLKFPHLIQTSALAHPDECVVMNCDVRKVLRNVRVLIFDWFCDVYH